MLSTRVSIMIIAALALCVSLVSPWRAEAQFVLYDDFSGPIVDPERWTGLSVGSANEITRAITPQGLYLKLTSWGRTLFNIGYNESRQGLFVDQRAGLGDITGLQARITVLAAKAQDCTENGGEFSATRGSVQLMGSFFNDGTGSIAPHGDKRGDILGVFELRKTPGVNQIVAAMRRCTSACGDLHSDIIGQPVIFLTPWAKNVPVTLRLRWDAARHQFNFTVNPGSLSSETHTISYDAGLNAYGPVSGEFKGVDLESDVEICAWWGPQGRRKVTTEALIDHVLVRR